MIEVLFLALALSMDAFAVSITLGTRNPSHVKKLALLAGLYFGIFQGLMPLIGHLGGIAIFAWLGGIANWIAATLLILIGAKMIYETLSSSASDDGMVYSHYALFTLAVATSIDALAAGFSLRLMQVNAILSCAIIAVVTFIVSYIGVYIGRKGSKWLKNKAELFGGAVLIILGIELVL